MSADDPQIRITATIDPTGATQGAAEVVNATQQVGAATKEAGEVAEDAGASAQRLQAIIRENQQQLMKQVFAIHRLAEGFKDIQYGGRMASQGIMDISEAAQYALAPELAIYVVIAQVVGMLALMATNHHHVAGEAKEHADAEKEAAEAITKTAEALVASADAAAKTHLEVLTTQLKDYLEVQKMVNEQAAEWNANADNRLGYLQKETAATQKLALAQLEHQKQVDLNAATSPEQREQIEADYKRREISMKGGDAQEANLAEQTLLAQQKQENDATRAQLLAENRENDRKLAALQTDAASKASKVQEEGFQPDEAGSFEGQIKNQEDVFKKAYEATAAARTNADTAATHAAEMDAAAKLTGPLGAIGMAATALAKQADEHAKLAAAAALSAQQQMTEESTKLADLRDAQSSREALKTQGKDLQDAITKNSASIDKLVEKLDEIYSKERVLSTESKTEAVTTDTEALAAGHQADKEKAKDDYDLREAQRYAQNKDQQKIIDDPNASPDAKAEAKAAQDRIEAAGKQDQLNYAAALGLTLTEITKLRADLGLDRAKASDVVAGQQKKDAATEQKALNKEIADGTKEAAQIIERSGNKVAVQQLHEAIKGQVVEPMQRLALIVQILTSNGLSLNGRIAQIEADVKRLQHP